MLRPEIIPTYGSRVLSGFILSAVYVYGMHLLFFDGRFSDTLFLVLPEFLLASVVFAFFLHVVFSKRFAGNTHMYITALLLLSAALLHVFVTTHDVVRQLNALPLLALVVPLLLTFGVFWGLRIFDFNKGEF